MNQKGFTPVFLLISILLILTVFITVYFLSQKASPLDVTDAFGEPIETPTPLPTNLDFSFDTNKFDGKSLNLHFEYPAQFGQANEKAGDEWSVNFSSLGSGFVTGYTTVLATTSDYVPFSWEGGYFWLDSKISPTDSIDSVKQKLKAENHVPLTIEKTAPNLQGASGFLVWEERCYSECSLNRFYLVPLANSDYNNLVIYSFIAPITKSNTDPQAAAIQKLNDVLTNPDSGTVTNIKNADLIFRTLNLNNMTPSKTQN